MIKETDAAEPLSLDVNVSVHDVEFWLAVTLKAVPASVLLGALAGSDATVTVATPLHAEFSLATKYVDDVSSFSDTVSTLVCPSALNVAFPEIVIPLAVVDVLDGTGVGAALFAPGLAVDGALEPPPPQLINAAAAPNANKEIRTMRRMRQTRVILRLSHQRTPHAR